MEWYVYNYNFNAHKIEKFNIFRHGSFREYAYKTLKICKDKTDFTKAIRGELLYYFGQNQNTSLS